MTISIQSSVVKNLPDNILQQLLVLNNGENGQMMWLLKSQKKAEAFYVYDDVTGKVISWGLVHKTLFLKKNTLNLYTAIAHRNKAWATRIIKTVQEKYPVVYGSHDCSDVFSLNGCKNSC